MPEISGEFKGSTTARLNRIEADVKELKDDVKAIRSDVSGWKAVIALAGFGLPVAVTIGLRILFP